jgi:hypothetical protein
MVYTIAPQLLPEIFHPDPRNDSLRVTCAFFRSFAETDATISPGVDALLRARAINSGEPSAPRVTYTTGGAVGVRCDWGYFGARGFLLLVGVVGIVDARL